jgi:hypothetical protein
MRSILYSVLTTVVITNAIRAADPPEVLELRKAGLNVGGVRTGGFSVGVRSATDLTEAVWKNLEAIDLRFFFLGGDGSQFGDKELARLCKIKSVERIFVNGPTITDDGLAALAEAPNLSRFGAHHAETAGVFRGTGFAALKDAKNFQELEFGGCLINDKGLEGLAQLTQLMTKLEHLGLGAAFSPDFTGADLRHLAGLKNLNELIVEKMGLPYDDGLSHLAALKHLKKLTLRECGITEEDLARLKKELPDTQIEFKPASEENIKRWTQALERKRKK